jgi:hypothetical protein
MQPRALRDQKTSPKRLESDPAFKLMKRGKLPKPFAKMGGSRLYTTELVDVSETHQVIFIWRDGELLTDRAFFAWLLKRTHNGSLYPLAELHWHPSHKGIHMKTPCHAEVDYTNRQLPGAVELDVRTVSMYDPREESDRRYLIAAFCKKVGITLGPKDLLS